MCRFLQCLWGVWIIFDPSKEYMLLPPVCLCICVVVVILNVNAYSLKGACVCNIVVLQKKSCAYDA